MKALVTPHKITTVYLNEDEVNGEGIPHMFHCFNCRVPIIQYIGHVLHVLPGMHPYEPSTVIKCKGVVFNYKGQPEECNYYYSFLGSVKTKRDEV